MASAQQQNASVCFGAGVRDQQRLASSRRKYPYCLACHSRCSEPDHDALCEPSDRPLSDLTKAAKKADQGDYEFTLDYDKNDEIGILTNTFRQLASHTREHINNLNRQVYVDALTSVRNKAGYGAAIAKLQEQMDDPNADLEFAFGVFDCDNLKLINDSFGHDKGDTYLKAASSLICSIFKHSPVFRIDGDEFAVILTNEDYNNREKLIVRSEKRWSDE